MTLLGDLRAHRKNFARSKLAQMHQKLVRGIPRETLSPEERDQIRQAVYSLAWYTAVLHIETATRRIAIDYVDGRINQLFEIREMTEAEIAAFNERQRTKAQQL